MAYIGLLPVTHRTLLLTEQQGQPNLDQDNYRSYSKVVKIANNDFPQMIGKGNIHVISRNSLDSMFKSI